MKKLTIKGMGTDQLRKVWENNQLFDEVSNDLVEGELHWITDQIGVIQPYLESWSVGQCNRDQHIRVKNSGAADFIYAFADMQKEYGVLGAEYDEKVGHTVLLANEYRETDMYTDRFDELEAWVEAESQKLADALCAEYTKILDNYCTDDKNAFTHFEEFYSVERMDGDEYVLLNEDGSSEWTLHKDISYTKTWN